MTFVSKVETWGRLHLVENWLYEITQLEILVIVDIDPKKNVTVVLSPYLLITKLKFSL